VLLSKTKRHVNMPIISELTICLKSTPHPYGISGKYTGGIKFFS
jgi:hypothetical protein